jgi:hypothetical protein
VKVAVIYKPKLGLAIPLRLIDDQADVQKQKSGDATTTGFAAPG